MKRLVIKLGSQCNWNCPHCHNEPVNYPYNAKLIDYIRKEGYDRITFSGGETLLYWKTIVKMVKELGKDYTYRIVTNGSLLNKEMTSFIEDYKIQVIVSFDGSDGKRTNNPPTNFRLLSTLKDVSFSVVVYQENMNFVKLQEELTEICRTYGIRPKLSLQPEFIHQTAYVHQDNNTLETAQEYCKQMARLLETEIVSLVTAPDDFIREARFMQFHTLRKSIGKWLKEKPKDLLGCRCFNPEVHCVSLDGRFLLCPYSDKRVIGHIETGIDWDKLQQWIPEKCKSCELFSVCRGACIANVTDHECYIARTMHRWLEKVCERYRCKEMLLTMWKEK